MGVAILISNKIGFKLKSIRRDREGHFILITGTIHQSQSWISMPPNIKAPKYVKETLLELKAHIKPHTLIVGGINTPLSPIDRSTRQKPNRNKRTNGGNEPNGLKDIYRTFHPNRKEYSFFSASHGTFLKIDHILGNKANFHRYKKNLVTTCVLSDHHGIKLEFYNNSTPQKAYKLLEAEQSTTEQPLDQGGNKERN